MKAVLDTNVVVAAFRSRRGASNALLREAAGNRFRLMVTTALFLEYEAVLMRPAQRAACGLSAADVTRVLDALAAVAEGVDVPFRLRPILPDANDELVLEAAVHGGADHLITFNAQDFAPAAAYGVTVSSPASALRALRDG